MFWNLLLCRITAFPVSTGNIYSMLQLATAKGCLAGAEATRKPPDRPPVCLCRGFVCVASGQIASRHTSGVRMSQQVQLLPASCYTQIASWCCTGWVAQWQAHVHNTAWLHNVFCCTIAHHALVFTTNGNASCWQRWCWGPTNGLVVAATCCLSCCAPGKGVTVYILDSGIKADHQEFQPWDGSSSRATQGPDFVDNDAVADDCDGHGTHVSSTGRGWGH